MQPKNFQFGGGAAGTILHPLIALVMLFAIVSILLLPRRQAVAPFLLAFFSIPLGQVLVLGGVHFLMQQILILTVLVKMATFKGPAVERRFTGGFNALDKVVVLWASSAFVIFSLQWMQTQAIVKSSADLLETLGGYLAVRFLVPDRAAFRCMLKALAAICMIQGACMLSEQFTHQNLLGFLGAFPSEIREGHVRSQGAMGTLYAGPLAGVLIPLFIWLWTEKKSRTVAYLGLGGATAMVFASFASTSWMAYGASLVALSFWPLRKQMRVVRWGLVSALLALHIVMHGPVWSLIEKIDLTGGSSSYHRYMLVDNCIRHFADWWLLGSKNYGDWGFVMFDVCNQFILVGLRGGLVTLIIYLAIYKRSFGSIGKARKRVAGNHEQEWLLWCLGSSLFTTVVSSFGINYMTYLMMCLFCVLVGISVATYEDAQVRTQALAKIEFESAPVSAGTCPPLHEARGKIWNDFES
jgi:hypothetical protein